MTRLPQAGALSLHKNLSLQTVGSVASTNEAHHNFDVLLERGQLSDAEDQLAFALRGTSTGNPVTSRHFTKLIRAYVEAPVPNHMQARSVFHRMKSHGFAPSFESYIFYMLSRYRDLQASGDSGALTRGRGQVRNIVKCMRNDNMNAMFVFRRVDLTRDQAVDVLNSLRLIWPDFKSPRYHSAVAKPSKHAAATASEIQWQRETAMYVSVPVPTLSLVGPSFTSTQDGGAPSAATALADALGDDSNTTDDVRGTVMAMKLAKLRDELVRCGADSKGHKAQLQERLVRVLHEDASLSSIPRPLQVYREEDGEDTVDAATPESEKLAPVGTPKLLHGFRESLIQRLAVDREEHNLLRRTETGTRPSRYAFGTNPQDHGEYMYSLTNDDLADLTLTAFENELRGHKDGAVLSSLTQNVGRAVCQRHFIKQHAADVSQQLQTVYASYVNLAENRADGDNQTARNLWDAATEQHRDDHPDVDSVALLEWPWSVVMQVGSRLIDLTVGAASMHDIDESMDVPAFFHTYDHTKYRTTSLVQAHPLLCRFFHSANAAEEDEKRGGPESLRLQASLMPMLTLPKPWLGVRSGPYLITPQTLVRVAHDTYQHLSLLSQQESQMTEIYDALNYLGTTPWTINERILDILLPLFQSGEAIPGLKVPAYDIPLPKRPTNADKQVRQCSCCMHHTPFVLPDSFAKERVCHDALFFCWVPYGCSCVFNKTEQPLRPSWGSWLIPMMSYTPVDRRVSL